VEEIPNGNVNFYSPGFEQILYAVYSISFFFLR
jgi:hypothetical protein